jgi:hypothetical protein
MLLLQGIPIPPVTPGDFVQGKMFPVEYKSSFYSFFFFFTYTPYYTKSLRNSGTWTLGPCMANMGVGWGYGYGLQQQRAQHDAAAASTAAAGMREASLSA